MSADVVPMDSPAVRDRAKEPKDVVYWRKLAVETAQRLQIAEAQLTDVRQAADDARARVTKYKGRLENAQQKVNELQSQLVTVSAERDDLRDRVARQDEVKRRVHEYRQSLLEGPLWDLFAAL